MLLKRTIMGNELRTVIIVDDEPTITDLLTNILAGKFETIAVGEQLQELICLIKEKEPCCVLVDVNLEYTDGRELCRGIKAELGESSPPVILVSGDDSEETIISCFENGADDFIAKPFSFTSVILSSLFNTLYINFIDKFLFLYILIHIL